MSDPRPLTTDDVVAKLNGIERALDVLADAQHTANLIAFADIAGRHSKVNDYKNALAQVRDRLGISTDRNPR